MDIFDIAAYDSARAATEKTARNPLRLIATANDGIQPALGGLHGLCNAHPILLATAEQCRPIRHRRRYRPSAQTVRSAEPAENTADHRNYFL